MSMNIILIGMDSFTVIIFMLILVFSIGIVWRVEKELDLSYKCFVIAAGCLVLGDIISLYANPPFDVVFLSKGLRIGGALFLLASVLLMRDLVRKLDGEKTPEK